jgi:hypothetical protein
LQSRAARPGSLQTISAVKKSTKVDPHVIYFLRF